MSEQHFVNRVHQTPFLEEEAKKLGVPDKPDPRVVPQTARQDLNMAKEAISNVLAKEYNFKLSDEPGVTATISEYQDFPTQEPEAQELGTTIPQTSDGQRAGQVGHAEVIEEDPEDSIGNIASTSSTFEVARMLELVRDPELVKLRAQVIQAFKHLGLNTRQFFPE